MSTCPGNCARCTLDTCVRQASTGRGATRGRHRGRGPSAPVPRDHDLVYLYDGTLEGFFSAVFATYVHHEHPCNIVARRHLQLGLLQGLREIVTRQDHAVRVHDGLVDKLGLHEYERIKVGFLSDAEDKGGIVYRYIAYAMHAGSWAARDHTHPDVADFDRIWQQVYGERHRMLQFARFSKTANGVYCAKIAPNANVVPLMMGHFAARFNTQPFLVYDEVHHIAGVSQEGRWWLVPTERFEIGPLAAGEAQVHDLWKRFYDAICNEERRNPRLRMGFMPKRLWGNLVEMDPLARLDTRNEFGLARPATAPPDGEGASRPAGTLPDEGELPQPPGTLPARGGLLGPAETPLDESIDERGPAQHPLELPADAAAVPTPPACPVPPALPPPT
jgi:probable DNA metabolism protein